MPSCRGCRQPIRWEKTRNGKMIALDPEPRDDGNVVLRSLSAGAGTIAHVLHDDEPPLEGELRYRAHWASCDKAEQFRRKHASR